MLYRYQERDRDVLQRTAFVTADRQVETHADVSRSWNAVAANASYANADR